MADAAAGRVEYGGRGAAAKLRDFLAGDLTKLFLEAARAGRAAHGALEDRCDHASGLQGVACGCC